MYTCTCTRLPAHVSPHAKIAGHWSLGTRLGYTHTDLRACISLASYFCYAKLSVCVCLHGEMHNFGCGITWTLPIHVHVQVVISAKTMPDLPIKIFSAADKAVAVEQ